MEVKKVSEAVDAYFKDVVGKPGHIIGVEKIEKGWKVLFEAVDDPGAGFDPILGLYEVTLDEEMNVTAYKRTSLRRRSELEWHAALE
jgi:hypothetical protein